MMGGSRRSWPVGILVLLTLALMACDGAWNNPYPDHDAMANTLYASFTERPKHLDPVQSYSAAEYVFIAQIYEPPLQYHYLRRPYELIPATASEVPRPRYFDAAGRPLSDDAPAASIAYSTYDIHIRPGIRYQPHPALAVDGQGRSLYVPLAPEVLERVHTLADFPQTGTRELTAADYVYQIKRLAHPRLNSPILGIMADYIVGLHEYATMLQQAYKQLDPEGKGGVFLDLGRYPLEGAQVVDRYTYRIKVRGKYPQLLYWLAMPFFSPMPVEADRFYSQPGLAERNITLDWYPIGTGPYMLTVNNPNLQMVLARNPNFHGETYPIEGEAEDVGRGLLHDAGRPLPFIDKVVFNLEKESIPYWNKFLQGYYDASGISSDSFDQAVQFGNQGQLSLTEDLQAKGIRLETAVAASTFYLGFNMLDPVLGGESERARKLRQAISIVIDYDEYISIFTNGRGIAAQGPLPPGIFGHRQGQDGINPYVYDWVDGRPRRKPIETARRLLAAAGYPGGVDAKTGVPLSLNFDIAAGGPEDKALLDWFRKQLKKIDVQLVIRATDYNRFQEKMRKGDAQIFLWGWNADYPDPENFLFLLYGPNGKAKHGGENAANYDNAEFNRLFEQMKNMDNTPVRQTIIDRMVEIARRDAVWLWGMHPKQFSLYHSWYHNAKPNLMANNGLKYLRIDAARRAALRQRWNRPVLWPLAIIALVLIMGTIPAILTYRRKEHAPPVLAAEVTRP